ncbi:MAG: prepilin-type N-terminal cleavage/methylation domain-containing protein [Gemmatimonadota bacterium]|nr:prepilin-type N-terminal cleavage/methylation domain-containing protein [Gemmatimonadota bacterium]
MNTRSRKGFSLIELMIAMIVMAIVLAGTMNFFMGQSRTFRKATTDMVLLQNARFANDLLSQHFRSVGSNLTVGQPAVIYIDQNTFAFNGDYATKVEGDVNSTYYEPNAPLEETRTLLQAQHKLLLNTTLDYPLGDYLDANGAPSPAETITFSFMPDTETARPDDYVLLRQVNAAPPEVVVRNVLPDSTYPFFRYMYLKTDPSGNQSIDTVPGASLPMNYADAAKVVPKDLLRGVIVSFNVTNGLADTAQRTRPVSVIASLPNVGMRELQTCGAKPLPVPSSVISKGGSGALVVTWTASPDETGGERDVMRYQVMRRDNFDTVWQTIASVPAGGTPPYTYTDGGLNPSVTYWYSVSAQDCTPASSPAASTGGLQPNP